MLKLIITASFLLVTQVSYGQVCDCNKALQQDYISRQMNESEFLNYLNTIDEQAFNQAKSGGGFGIDIPIEGIPIGVDANWNDFSEWRNKKFTQTGFTSGKAESILYLQKTTSEKGYNSFDNCINRCTANNGLFVSVINSSKTDITIEIYYKPAPSPNGKLEPISIADSRVLMGGTQLKDMFSTSEMISPNQSITKIISRPKNEDVVGYINAGGYTANFKVNRFPISSVPILISAKEYNSNESSGICSGCFAGYGEMVTNNSIGQPNVFDKAVYDIVASSSGTYKLEIQYTAAESRGVNLYVNNALLQTNVCNSSNGSWYEKDLRWETVSLNVYLIHGHNKLKLTREGAFPHLNALKLTQLN